MMFFNKKLAAVVLLVSVFGQMGAMKRKLELGMPGSSAKRPKLSHSDKATFVIPYSFPSYSNVPTEEQFVFSSETYVPQSQQPVISITDSGERCNKLEVGRTNLMVDYKESRKFAKFSDSYHQHKLFASIRKGDVEEIVKHLEKVPTVTPLMVSLIFSSEELTESQKIPLILQLQTIGVNLNTSDPHVEGGSTPLHWAADLNQTKVLEELLRVGCNPNALDNDMQTPLFGTTSPETALVLKRGGANLEHRDHKGRTALFSAGTTYELDMGMAAFYALHNPHLINRKDNNEETAYDRSERKFNNPNEGVKDEEMVRKLTIAPILFAPKNMSNPVFAQRQRETGMRKFNVNDISL